MPTPPSRAVIIRGVGDDTRNLSADEDTELSPPPDPPLTDEERARLLEALSLAHVPERFRESFRRDIE